jgi:hypothetical protein
MCHPQLKLGILQKLWDGRVLFPTVRSVGGLRVVISKRPYVLTFEKVKKLKWDVQH